MKKRIGPNKGSGHRPAQVPAQPSIDLDVTFCRQDQDLREVRQLMEARGLDMIPVVDANQRLVGVVYRCEPR